MRDECVIKVAGRNWKIKMVDGSTLPRNVLGTCTSPAGRHPTIEIRKNMSDKKTLEVVIHEVMHASLPLLDEAAVETSAHEICKGVFAMGWRRV